MNMEQLYIYASRAKLRWTTAKGGVNIEQLWDLPLTSPNGFDLDTVAKAVHAELKVTEEGSFVQPTPTTQSVRLNAMMDLVKHVIATKLAEKEAAAKAVENAAQRKKLLSILDKKQDSALEALTPEQIKEELAKLS